MDRSIIYIGQIPQDTDLLNTNKNVMIGLGYALQAILGTSTVVDGLPCTPNSPAALNVLVAPGSIYSLQNVDGTAYGSIAADTTDQIVKQGIVTATTTLSCPAPATTGYSVVYLVEVAYQDTDSGSTVLPYYNAANPSVAWSGPSNSGVSQNTVRKGVCTVAVKTGVAAPTGTQTTPPPDAGYTGLYAITVANGQTTITSGNIQVLASAPFIGAKLPAILSAIQAGTPNYADDSSVSANTITVALSPIPAALNKGMPIRVKVANTNTGATVLNINGLGNVSVVTANGSALSAGALQANGIYTFVYDANGTRWQIQGITTTTATNGYYYGSTSGGSANTQTLATVTPSGFALTHGNAVSFTAGYSNTGATTLAVNSTTATAVNKDTGSGIVPLTGGEIVAGDDYVCYYDGTQYVLIDPSTLAFLNSPALTGTPTAPTAAIGTNSTQVATTAFVQAALNISSSLTSNTPHTFTATGLTNFMSLTGFTSLTITPPSASNKVQITGTLFLGSQTTTYVGIQLLRNGTVVWSGQVGIASGATTTTMPINFIDSPGSASAVTYSLQISGPASTNIYLNQDNATSNPVCVSTLNAMVTN